MPESDARCHRDVTSDRLGNVSSKSKPVLELAPHAVAVDIAGMSCNQLASKRRDQLDTNRLGHFGLRIT